MTAATETAELNISVRELRLVVKRILLISGLSAGLIPTMREVVLRSEAMRLGGLKLMQQRYETLGRPDPADVHLREQADGTTLVDANGLHAWVIGPALLDLAIDDARSGKPARLLAVHVEDIGELRVLEALAPLQGARVSVRPGAPAMIACTAAASPVLLPDPALQAVLRSGFSVRAALWWELYHLSNRSLTPDSVLSRRHAGPIILEPDGRITGRPDSDDDTDLALLGAADNAGGLQPPNTAR